MRSLILDQLGLLYPLLKKEREMGKSKYDRLEIFISIFPVLCIAMLSVWHGFGIQGVQPWKAIYMLSTLLLCVYSGVIGWMFLPYSTGRKICLYIVIPYFTIKIIYHILDWCNVFGKNEELWAWIWGIICILVIVICLIVLWMNLKKDGL